ncbi:hypothetical protein NA56DRAFT_697947 [Hyaloscypha hepaticicola]|uniref:Heterokaryon incompatibility domain-containing protein n=1 Tax=Hyaloscypha hepaticicola TaxID=2082293 RepID=A0A2J6QKE2_9HELO|nr:hypothetical protein NA56DRAFT_697947 [Hyaloscypha hepaticicola]
MDDLMQYEPENNFYRSLPGLHAFRLLILEPGHVSQPVSIRLQVVERATAPAYDAISYVWGDPKIRILWADAICINQSDLPERSNQVMFMGSLYSNASKVYICKGEARDGNDFHVQTVLNDAITLGPSSLPLLPDNHPIRNDWRWYALGILMESPWFSRTWVVQEAALANESIVLYGRAEFGYRNLVTVVRYLNSSTWAIKFILSASLIHIEWADWRVNVHGPAYSDKVYAFLGHPLAYPLTGTNLVRPDYRKTPAQVYLELSKALIQQTGLRVLTTVEHNQATILEDFPSWVTR